MSRGRDEAGNIWELDANGNPVRLVQAANAAPSAPGSIAGHGTFIPAPPKAPEGFRYTPDGRGLEAIPGGPADKKEKAPSPPEGYRWSGDGKSLEVIPGGPKDTSSQGDVPPIGDMTKTGKAYFDSLPDSYKGTVRQLLSNHLVLSSFAMAKPYYQAAINAASRIDPTYDPSLAQPRATALKDFTGAGKASTAVGAMNRLAANLKELKSISDKMGGPNLGVKPVNSLIASAEQQAMPTLVARYDALLPEIATQFDLVMKGAKGSGATVSGIGDAKQTLDRHRSLDERNGAFQEIVRAVHGAIQPVKDQWDSAYGGTRAPPMWISKDASDFFSSVDPEHADTYGGNDWRGLPGLKGDALPWEMAAFTPPGSGPPSDGGGTSSTPPPVGPPGSLSGPRANYSSMVGGNAQSLATTGTRNVDDPVVANAVAAFIKKGVPYDTVAAYLQSHGVTPNPELPKQYAAALTFQQNNPGATPNVEALKSIPTTVGERRAASPGAAFLAGAATGATAGLSDVVGRNLVGPEWDANRAALSATHGTADTLGNIAGGVGGAVIAPELLAKYAPGALGAAGRIGQALDRTVPGLASVTGDAAYGATYGASEDPNNPLGGGLAGAITGAAGGIVGRRATRGLANVIAPPAGDFAPLYQAGVRPTPGQRFGSSGLAGRMLNGTEQAMQSFPVLGAAPASARQATRDAFQVGAFNNSLKELEPFKAAGVDLPTALPRGVGPGTDAHALTADAFGKAYDTARSGMQFVPDQQYLQEANQLEQKVNSGVLSPAQAQQVQSLVGNAVVGRLKAQGGVLNGDAYKAASSDLGGAIETWSKNPDTAPMADALSDYASIFDNAARRNSDPAAVNLLDAADRGYAQFVRIQKASQMGGAAKDAGTFTPVNYAGAVKQMGGGVRSNAYSRGNALGQDYANAGLNLRETLADSGTPMRLGVIGALQGAEGAGLAMTGHLGVLTNPGALGAFAPYAPGVRKLTNAIIAPREFTLPPAIANPLNLTGTKLNDLAPFIGAGAVPGALAYRMNQ